MFLPSTPIVHSRQWKGQVPYFSRRHRVVAFDGRGNGRSDRPTDAAAYHDDRFVEDLEAVMDATDTARAVLVGLCTDYVWRAIRFAAGPSGAGARDRRLRRSVSRASHRPSRTMSPRPPRSTTSCRPYEGWSKYNRHHWRRDYADFARFFFEEITSEPHSTKVIEDAVEWALDGSVDAMIADNDARFPFDQAAVEAICRAVTCPMLLVHGTEDTCQPLARAATPRPRSPAHR